ncbi:MAG: chromate transporter [Acholeplasmataceae bacterium]
MIEYLKLFWIFFKIGLFTFGGGYAMIPLMRHEVIFNGYLTGGEMDQFIGIAESTPGPLSVNLATFVGFNTHGFLGSLFATLGVILPSFIIILLIAYFSDKVLKSKVSRTILGWINPLSIGLILSAGIIVFINTILGDLPWMDGFNVDYIGLVIFGVILTLTLIFKKLNPIYLIITSGVLGLIFYSIF